MSKHYKTLIQAFLAILFIVALIIASKPHLSPYFKNQGLKLAEKNYFNEAVFFLNMAAFLNPQDSQVHYKLGEIYFDKNLYRLANDQLQLALHFNPKLTAAHVIMAKIHKTVGEYDQALEHLKNALALEPFNRQIAHTMEALRQEYVQTQIEQAAASFSQHDIAGSLSSLQKAFDLSNETPVSLFIFEHAAQPDDQTETEQQVEQLKLMAQEGQLRYKVSRLIADKYLALRRYPQAIAFYLRCLDEKPHNVSLLNNIGVAHFQSGNLDKAVEYFRKALSFRPDSADIIYSLARCYEQKQWPLEAKRLYELLVPHETDMPYIYLALARIAAAEGQHQRARTLLEKTIDLAEHRIRQNTDDSVARITSRLAKERLIDLMSLDSKREGRRGN